MLRRITLKVSRSILLLLLLAVVTAAFLPFFLLRSEPLGKNIVVISHKPLVNNQRNVPVAGSIKFGMYIDTPTPYTVEKDLHYKLNITGQFIHFNQNLANDKLKYACKQGYVPLITWESWTGPNGKKAPVPGGPKVTTNDFSLTAIAAGQDDDLLRGSLRALAQACQNQTVIIRFDHEMDGASNHVKYYPWQDDSSAYIAAWKHVVTLGRETDSHIKWLWSPNRATRASNAYYPGNDWVDYVGLTLNRNGAVVSQWNAPYTFQQFYQQNSLIESYDKPVIIGETTSLESTSNPQFKANWAKNMFTYVKANKKIVAIVWFNTGSSYSYNSSPQVLQTFRKGLLSCCGE